MEEVEKKPAVSKPQMLVAIGVRWYKDGKSELQVKKDLKVLSDRSIEEIEKAFNECFCLPG